MPLPDFSTLQPVGSSPLPDFGSLKPVEDAAQPPAANSLQLSTSQTPSTPEALAHQNIQGNQKFFNDMASKAGVTPDEYQQRVFQEAQANQDAALDSADPRNSKTPVGAFGVELLKQLHDFASDPSKSALDSILQSKEISKEDSAPVAVGKEAYNLLATIPKFATSPLGVVTGGAGKVVKPGIMAAAWTADMVKNLGQTILRDYQNWDKMSNGEKAAAVTEVVGTAGLAGFTGAHAAEDLSGVRSPGVRSFESTPMRNAKDLSFALNQTTPKLPGSGAIPPAPVVGQPNQPGVRPDLSKQPAPVAPIPTAEGVNTGRVSLPNLAGSDAINQITPQIQALGTRLGRIPTSNEVINEILPHLKDKKYPGGRSIKDVVGSMLDSIYPQRKPSTTGENYGTVQKRGSTEIPLALRPEGGEEVGPRVSGTEKTSLQSEPESSEAQKAQSVGKGELNPVKSFMATMYRGDPNLKKASQTEGGTHWSSDPEYASQYVKPAMGEQSSVPVQRRSVQLKNPVDLRNVTAESTIGDLKMVLKNAGVPSGLKLSRRTPGMISEGIKTISDLISSWGSDSDKLGSDFSPNESLTDFIGGSLKKLGNHDGVLFNEHGDPKNITAVVFHDESLKENPKNTPQATQAGQEKVKPGMIRLYNGASDVSGTSWWTPDPERAAGHAGEGGTVKSVDVPKADYEAGQKLAKQQGSGTAGDAVLDRKHTDRAQPVAATPKVTDITGADKPVEPKNAADLVNMSPEDAGKWFQSLRGKTGEAESNAKTARAQLTKGMTDQEVLDASNEAENQTRELMKDPVKNGDIIGANTHKVQFLREALHDRGYSREYESGKTLEEQIAAMTSGGGTTGIAHRVSEARGVAAERGQGASPAAQVEHGRQLLAGGADPEKILSDFQSDPRKATSSDGFSILRARQEQLAKAADRAVDEHGASSPKAVAAAKADSDWIEKIKPYQTEWAKQGTAQQGETDLDTGSFTALRRSFESESKKPMTPKQSRDLQKIAVDNKKASDEVDAAIKAVTESVDKSPVSERLKSITQKVYDALDEQAKAALQRLNARRAKVGSSLAPQDLADYAILGAAQIAKGIIKFPEWSKSMLDQFGDVLKSDDLERVYDLAKQKQLDEIRNNFGEFKSGKAFTPDQVKTLWKYAKDNYITGGEVNFAKIRNNLSNDFGLSKPDVARALTQNSTTRNLLDNAYTKQYRARQLRQYAKTWIKREATPSLVRKIQAIPRGLFNLAVFGHGTTWIGTHAGQNLYDPTQWVSLGRNYAKIWKVAYSRVEYEKEAQDLVARPNWETARRAGVNNDPYTRQGDYDTPELTKWAKTMGIGHRGALGLMTLRQDYFDTVWDNLSATDKNKEMAKYVADLTNHATGTTRMKMVENPWTNLLLFAPRLVASRFQWDIADPARAALIKGFGLLGKKPTAQEAMFANHVIKKRAIFVATLLSALGLNQIVLNATGSKQKINLTRPHESDWLRFKEFGMEVAPFSAGVAVARLMAQEYSDFFVNHKHRGGLPFNPAEQAGTDALRYGRAELSPVASHSLDLAAQSDYSGRPLPAIPGRNPPPDEPAYLKREGVKPYTWIQYGLTAAPIPAEGAIQEAFQTQGMNESAAKKYTKLILSAAAMASTGVLVKEDPKAKQ